MESKEFSKIIDSNKNTIKLRSGQKRPKVSDPDFLQYAENKQHQVFDQIEPMIDFKNAQNESKKNDKTNVNIRNPLFKMGDLVEKKLQKFTLIQSIQQKNKSKEK